jgi:hypothetical protein
MSELVIAEMWQAGECIARWTDEDGPPDLADRLPHLREQGWTVHDFRDDVDLPERPVGSEENTR